MDDPIEQASSEVKKIIKRVLDVEKSRLDKNEQGRINEDILKIVKEEVQ